MFKVERTFKYDKTVPYLMKQRSDKNGYLLIGKGLKVHRMVADAHIPNPEKKPQVAHNNGVPSDNRVENLRWATVSENLMDRRAHGTASHASRKLSSGQLVFARAFVDAGFSIGKVAPVFGLARETLGKALRGVTYVTR